MKNAHNGIARGFEKLGRMVQWEIAQLREELAKLRKSLPRRPKNRQHLNK